MAFYFECKKRLILRIRGSTFCGLTDTMISIFEGMNQKNEAMNDLLENITCQGILCHGEYIELSDYLHEKKDVLLFADLVKSALEIEQKGKYPYRQDAYNCMLSYYHELLRCAYEWDLDTPKSLAVALTCKDRRVYVRDVISLTSESCKNFYTLLQSIVDDRQLKLTNSIKQILSLLIPPYQDNRIIELSTFITEEEDAKQLAALVKLVIEKNAAKLSTYEQSLFLILHYRLLMYAADLAYYDEQGLVKLSRN